MAQSTKNVAIMFTDVVGYTSMMSEDESQAHTIVNEMRSVQKGHITEYGGTLVKELGDGVMAYFDNTEAALTCAVNIQAEISKSFDARLRIGIHRADVIFENEDIFGDGVNIASRIEALADPGGVYFSQAAEDALGPDSNVQRWRLGRARLKNVNGLTVIFAAQGEGLAPVNMQRFRSLARPKKKLATVPTVVVFLVFIAAAVLVYNYLDNRALIREAEARLVDLQELVDESWRDYAQPFYLGQELKETIPENPVLNDLIEQSSVRINVTSEPSGAEVFVKLYNQPEAEWQALGVTPIESAQVPITFFRWKLVKDGYEPVEAAAFTFESANPSKLQRSVMRVGQDFHRDLDEIGTLPEDMTRVAGDSLPFGRITDFFIDKYEVTNAAYLQFLNAGGYTNLDYWSALIGDLQDSSKAAPAMAMFVDKSGTPGPSSWENGTYPEGEGNHPVTGVSWYEASAYASYVGKVLPTQFHWGLARGEATRVIRWPQLGGNALFAPFNNFDGDAPEPVGTNPGITSFGAYDMPGNVREWCLNESSQGRWMRGGSYGDNPYMFGSPSQADPMDRSVRNGFRCAVYPEPESIPEIAFMWSENNAPVPFPIPPLPEPVTEEVFESFREFYAYDPTELNAEILRTSQNPRGWTLELVEVDAGYPDERVPMYLFTPSNAAPPYQTIVYGPGSGVFWQESSENIEDYYEFRAFLDFFVKSGRAVVFPVVKGSFERRTPSSPFLHMGAPTRDYTALITSVVKDYRRCLDYMETREDFNMEKVAFYGMSWGPRLGFVLSAIEPRIKLNLFYAGGVVPIGRPEVNEALFAPRVTAPTLMLNGRFDSIFRLDHEIRSMFELLGTPEEHKNLVLVESDHLAPRPILVRETLAWLDEYFGQVIYIGEERRMGQVPTLPSPYSATGHALAAIHLGRGNARDIPVLTGLEMNQLEPFGPLCSRALPHH